MRGTIRDVVVQKETGSMVKDGEAPSRNQGTQSEIGGRGCIITVKNGAAQRDTLGQGRLDNSYLYQPQLSHLCYSLGGIISG